MRFSPITLRDGQLEFLKWVAMATMVIDHVFKISLEGDKTFLFMTAIGRLAFPLFAFLAAYHLLHHTRSPNRYMLRLLVMGVISQPIYMWAQPDHHSLNIFFTLAAGLFVTNATLNWEKRADSQLLMALVVAFILVTATGFVVDYNHPGIFLIPAFALWLKYFNALSTLMLGCLLLAANTFNPLGIPALLVLPLIVSLPNRDWAAPRLPHWIYYIIYPAHMALLRILLV